MADYKALLAQHEVAAAPYNFIPLNSIILKPDTDEKFAKGVISDNSQDVCDAYKKEMLSKERYSGYFMLQLNTVTPTFIGMEADSSNTFAVDNRCYIPGSSLRGCIKNLYKILTSSSFRVKTEGAKVENADTEDQNFFYRGVGKPVTLKITQDYKDKIKISRDRQGTINFENVYGGYLVKIQGQYYMYMASLSAVKYPKDMPKDDIPERETRPRPDIKWTEDGCEFFTGLMSGKDHFYVIGKPKEDSRMLIGIDRIELYKKDSQRTGLSLINSDLNETAKKQEKNNLSEGFARTGESIPDSFKAIPTEAEYVIPCFYTGNTVREVRYFGSNPYMRIPALNSVKKLIPANLQSSNPDFTDMVFGFKNKWSSKLSFENMYMDAKTMPKYCSVQYSQILLGPKPSSGALYLEPAEMNGKNGNVARSWNDNGRIRGYKFYWHKTKDWSLVPEKDQNLSVLKKMQPLDKGNKFFGKLHFKNLDKYEFGALLYLFKIIGDKNHCIKLGAGQPIGMGSVAVSAKPFLEDKDYFNAIFDVNGFVDAKEIKPKDQDSYIDSYLKYVKDQLGDSVYENEYVKHLEALKMILSMELAENYNSKLLDETRYMDIEGTGKSKYELGDADIYNYCCPLPSIEEVYMRVKEHK